MGADNDNDIAGRAAVWVRRAIAILRDRLRRCRKARGCGNRLCWAWRTAALEAPSSPLSSSSSSSSSLATVCFVSLVLSRRLLTALSDHFTLFIPYPPLSSPSRLLALPHYYGNEVSATARNAGRSVSPFFGREHLRLRCHTQGDCVQRPCRGMLRLHEYSNPARLMHVSEPLPTAALRSELW